MGGLFCCFVGARGKGKKTTRSLINVDQSWACYLEWGDLGLLIMIDALASRSCNLHGNGIS